MAEDSDRRDQELALAALPQPTSGEESSYKGWIKELTAAAKREQKYRKEARDLVKIYEGGRGDDNEAGEPFNILYSNTETLAPTVYNAMPRPVVRQRNKSKTDPVAAAASKIMERALVAFIDPGTQDYAALDDLMEMAVVDALVTDRGLIRFEFKASETPEGAVADEHVCAWLVPWDHFLCDYGRSWEDKSWICFEHFMTRKELQQNFKAKAGEPDYASAIKLENVLEDSLNAEAPKTNEEGMADVMRGHVYEIWDKTTLQVVFLSSGLPDRIIKAVPDPLNLSGFYPTPAPLYMCSSITRKTPIPLYRMYKQQAKELNDVTRRITGYIEVLKVRGAYDSMVEGLAKLLEADEFTMLPVDNLASVRGSKNGGGLEESLWFVPTDKLAIVLQSLLQYRQQIKSTIYEITGLADIMRGASVASETATAQDIKNQWGSLRVKKFQRRVSKYARSCLRIMGEIIVEHVQFKTLLEIAEVDLPTNEQKKQMQMQAQLSQLQAQQAPPGSAGPTGPTGASQAGPPLNHNGGPPMDAGHADIPTQEEVEALLKNDFFRSYSIDVETNSTVDAEATEDKQNIAELMNALSQFLNGVAPLIEQGALPFDAAKAIMLAIVRRFQFGPEIEDELEAMQAPQPKADPKADQAKAEGQLKIALGQLQLQIAKQEHDFKMKEMALEHEFKMQELQGKMVQAGYQSQIATQGAVTDQFAGQGDLQLQAQQNALAQNQAEHENAMQQQQQELERQAMAQKAQEQDNATV